MNLGCQEFAIMCSSSFRLILGLLWDGKSTRAKDSMYCSQASHSGYDATEKRMINFYIHILCRFQKSKWKVPPPSPLSTKYQKRIFFSNNFSFPEHFSFHFSKSYSVFYILKTTNKKFGAMQSLFVLKIWQKIRQQ